MKSEMYINLLGHCEKCDHIMTRNAKVSLDEDILTPCECPECHEGNVYFEKLAVHHKTVKTPVTKLVCPSEDTFKRMKHVFEWGILAIGTFVMLACGFVLRYGDTLAPVWKYTLIGGFVLILAVVWLFLIKAFNKAASLDWVNAHSILPKD